MLFKGNLSLSIEGIYRTSPTLPSACNSNDFATFVVLFILFTIPFI